MSPTTGCTQGNKISFLAYCEMMEAFGLSGVCDEIHGTRENGWKSVPVERDLCQGDVGDGFVMYPRHSVIQGTEQLSEWRHIKYWNLVDENAPRVFERAMFFSGAFNILEIPSIPVGYDTRRYLGIFREDMPIKLFDGIQELFGRCLKNGTNSSKCLKNNETKELATALNTIVEHLKPKKNEDCVSAKVRRFTARLNQLKENYMWLEGRVQDRAKLTAAVAPYIKSIPKSASEPKDIKNAIGQYRQMVKIAIMQYYGEKGVKIPSAETERNGVPTDFRKSNPFGNGNLDAEYIEYDDSIDGSDRDCNPSDF